MSFPESYPESYPDPVYDGPGEVSARIRPGDAEPDLLTVRGVAVHHLATGASTDGAFGLYRWEFGPGQGGPDPHFHRTTSESFYVLDGTVDLYDGDRWVTAGSGDFLHVPPGGVHAFRGSAPARMLLLFTPGAPREAYFAALDEMARAGTVLADDERDAFFASHDQYHV